MDALKILCRSTTLSRKSSKQAPQKARPSSGEARNPQLFGRDESFEIVQDSRKRKREDSSSPPAQQDPQLDFFNAQKKKLNATTADAADQHRRHESKKNPRSIQNEQLEDEVAIELPEDECRRILKSHKLKVTPIWPVQEEQAPTTLSRRKAQRSKGLELENLKKKKRKIEIIPQPLVSFAQLRSRYGVGVQLARNIEEQGYTIPTEVQLGALPLLLSRGKTKAGVGLGRSVELTTVGSNAPLGPDVDLLAVAPTGSGKTLAFLIPILDAIAEEKTQAKNLRGGESQKRPSAIIVVPTKELAAQIVNEARKLALKTGISISRVRRDIRFWTGNDSQELLENNDEASSDDQSGRSSNEAEAIEPNPPTGLADVLVTTPLTLVKAITANEAATEPLNAVRNLVFDEADVLLDTMFRSQTLKIWSACTNPNLRVSLWSATMGSSIEDLATATILARRKKISAPEHAATRNNQPRSLTQSQIIRLVVGLKDSAIPSIQHKLIYAANEAGKLLAMRQLLRPTGNSTAAIPRIHPPFLVFTQTIPRAIALASELRYDIPAQASSSGSGSGSANTARLAVLHADLSDAARASIMARFRAAEIWVLITTDLLSRGVDFRGVNAVVNYDLPSSSAAYVHRVGRTGRAGREGGVAVTLYAEEDVSALKNVVNVVQAAEKAGKVAGDESAAQQDWLFRSLPKLNKREKQRLRKRGVESRREVPDAKFAGKLPRSRTRISTKSGYERRLENQRKTAAAAERERRNASEDN